MKLFSILLLTVAGVLCSCSTTVYGPDGKPLMRAQSDAKDFAYSRTADGAVTLTASTLSNSAPVLAAGKALTPLVMAVGTTAMMNATTKVVDAVKKPAVP